MVYSLGCEACGFGRMKNGTGPPSTGPSGVVYWPGYSICSVHSSSCPLLSHQSPCYLLYLLPFPGYMLRITLGYLWEVIRNFLKLMMTLVAQFWAYANTHQAMNI